MIILSNRWLQSSMIVISVNVNMSRVSQFTSFWASVSNQELASTFVTLKAAGACMHTFTFPNTIRIWRNRILFPLCVWCYIIILLTNNCGLFVLGTEASSWTSLWIQQEFDLCVVETFILTPAQLYAVICYGKWMINKELINFIDQQQSW